MKTWFVETENGRLDEYTYTEARTVFFRCLESALLQNFQYDIAKGLFEKTKARLAQSGEKHFKIGPKVGDWFVKIDDTERKEGVELAQEH